jgi:hypothetical protein
MWCGQAELREPEAQTEHAGPLPDHASFVRRSYEIEYATERAAGIRSLAGRRLADMLSDLIKSSATP